MELDLDLFDDSDEDDAVFAHFGERGRRLRTVRVRPNNFDKWNDEEFFIRFSLTKPTVMHLLTLIEDEIETDTDRNHSVMPMNKLLITLRFYALGSMLIASGDFGGVHKSTACRIIRDVSDAIARLRPTYIRFPNSPEEFQELKEGFYAAARFPNVVAAIDCTHIKIQSPGGNQAETFRNRKGFFSLNVQTLCASNLRIMDIVARWPGSAHDRNIFNNSTVKARFEMGEMGDGLILGDSGYTLSPYLITPLRNPITPEETLFNESQIRTRTIVERQYGVWKRRFPVLSLGMRLSMARVQAVIIATAVLHNMACEMGEEVPSPDPDLQEIIDIQRDQIPVVAAPAHLRGEGRIQCALIQNYFRRLHLV